MSSHFFRYIGREGEPEYVNLARASSVTREADVAQLTYMIDLPGGPIFIAGADALRLRERLDHLAATEDAVVADQQRETGAATNTALVDAAPEMLRCAQMLALVAAEGEFKSDAERLEMLGIARAAIAKATATTDSEVAA